MKTKVFLTIVLVILTTYATMAQGNENRFGIELNGDVIFVSTELNGASLNTGLGFETIPLTLVLRIYNEEMVLRKELTGYTEYCQTTKYRLIPFIWQLAFRSSRVDRLHIP